MKIYPKKYENVFKTSISEEQIEKIQYVNGTRDEMIVLYKKMFREHDRNFLQFLVRSFWLQYHFVHNGNRRLKHRRNGCYNDWMFGFFHKNIVGYSQKHLNQNAAFTTMATYLKEFFPEFLSRDPFKEPEYYSFPYDHVGICHMIYVAAVHNRIDLLNYAEEHKMTFAEFVNWATNQSFCYNDDVGRDVYVLWSSNDSWPFLKNTGLDAGWKDDLINFHDPERKSPKSKQPLINKYIRKMDIWKGNITKNGKAKKEVSAVHRHLATVWTKYKK